MESPQRCEYLKIEWAVRRSGVTRTANRAALGEGHVGPLDPERRAIPGDVPPGREEFVKPWPRRTGQRRTHSRVFADIQQSGRRPGRVVLLVLVLVLVAAAGQAGAVCFVPGT